MVTEDNPYDEFEKDKYYIRKFYEDTDESLLKWHWDDEDRTVISLGETDWKFQFDNELPQSLNESIFIPKGVMHRVIKGSGDLLIKIIKH